MNLSVQNIDIRMFPGNKRLFPSGKDFHWEEKRSHFNLKEPLVCTVLQQSYQYFIHASSSRHGIYSIRCCVKCRRFYCTKERGAFDFRWIKQGQNVPSGAKVKGAQLWARPPSSILSHSFGTNQNFSKHMSIMFPPRTQFRIVGRTITCEDGHDCSQLCGGE